MRDLHSGAKSQSHSSGAGLSVSNPNQQKQEVVFGKSAAPQKTSPTSPQNPSPQKSANNGGSSAGQQAPVSDHQPSKTLECISRFQHVDNEFIEKLVEEMRRVKIIVKGHERRIKTLEDRLSQYEAPVDDLDD